MAVTEYAEMDGVTISTTEISFVSGTSTLPTETADGVFQLWIDANNMEKDDIFVVRAYEKVEATGGTKRVFFVATLANVQSQLWVMPPVALMHGWDFTIQRTAGTDRAFDASIRQLG